MTLVVDAAVDLPPDLRDSPRVRVASQDIWCGEQPFEGDRDRFWVALRAGERFATTAPTLGALCAAYEGGGGVCAVHVSGELSATVARAREAAARVAGPVAIVDSRSLSVGAGLVAHLADEAMRVGGSWSELTGKLSGLADRVHTFVLVNDVDTLRRSERISLLPAVHLHRHRPVLLAVRGRALVIDQPKDRAAGLSALATHARHSSADSVSGWALGHGDAGDVARVAARLARELGREPLYTCYVDPIVGSHVGPGAVVVGVF